MLELQNMFQHLNLRSPVCPQTHFLQTQSLRNGALQSNNTQQLL